MYRIFRHYVPKTLIMLGVAEALILLVSVYLGVTLKFLHWQGGTAPAELLFVKAALFAGVMVATMTAMGLYQRDLRESARGILFRITLSFAVGLVAMAAVYQAWPELFVGRGAFAVALFSSFLGISSCRFLCYHRTDRRLARRVLVLGAGEQAARIRNLRRRTDRSGVDLVGYVHLGTGAQRVHERVLDASAGLAALVERLGIDEVVVALDDRRAALPVKELLECKMRGVLVIEAANYFERQLGKIRLDSLHPSQVIFCDGFHQNALKAGSKRLFDLVVGTLALALAWPLMLAVALAIKLDSPRGASVIFRQQRVGRFGEVFEVLKFRSMRTDAEADGVARWASRDDARITRVGAFIRKTRLDELPQLINVLRGEMSFVGPRPERPEFTAELREALPYYDLRHHAKPGITGWAQVCYPYGASLDDAREKLQYDLYYLKNYSVFLDFAILAETVQVVIWGKGSR